MKLLALLLLFIPVAGITLHGTVLDSSLEPIEAIVEINNPRQVAAAADGGYSFEVAPNNNYSLTARTTSEPTLQETIQLAVGDGDIRFDIILLSPAGLEEGDADVSETAQTLSQNASLPESIPLAWIATIIIAIAAILIIALAFSRQKQKPLEQQTREEQRQVEVTAPTEKPLKMDNFKEKILTILRQKDGAAEQKELR
ncbi:carboxypeptidase regulatory-like domain-containing protein, partial [Candidatus Micrarchaeota archaeon]|nr:carboxypeptidase regulatory-like domain-containing protein [Candidatus Micrarchaeota archaeon]